MATRHKSAAPAASAPASAPALDASAPEATPEESREDAIRRAAYAAAERRNFAPGFEEEDWLTAEREFDAKFDNESTPGAA